MGDSLGVAVLPELKKNFFQDLETNSGNMLTSHIVLMLFGLIPPQSLRPILHRLVIVAVAEIVRS